MIISFESNDFMAFKLLYVSTRSCEVYVDIAFAYKYWYFKTYWRCDHQNFLTEFLSILLGSGSFQPITKSAYVSFDP